MPIVRAPVPSDIDILTTGTMQVPDATPDEKTEPRSSDFWERLRTGQKLFYKRNAEDVRNGVYGNPETEVETVKVDDNLSFYDLLTLKWLDFGRVGANIGFVLLGSVLLILGIIFVLRKEV